MFNMMWPSLIPMQKIHLSSPTCLGEVVGNNTLPLLNGTQSKETNPVHINQIKTLSDPSNQVL